MIAPRYVAVTASSAQTVVNFGRNSFGNLEFIISAWSSVVTASLPVGKA